MNIKKGKSIFWTILKVNCPRKYGKNIIRFLSVWLRTRIHMQISCLSEPKRLCACVRNVPVRTFLYLNLRSVGSPVANIESQLEEWMETGVQKTEMERSSFAFPLSPYALFLYVINARVAGYKAGAFETTYLTFMRGGRH